jgi:UDP-N-acetylmuramoyl-tripeptide--D-alanyl-D-alanine ligase
MGAAIQTVSRLKGSHRAILILGDMLELGPEAETLHKGIGTICAGSGISRLYVTGTFSSAVAAGATEHGLAENRVFKGSKEEISNDLMNRLQPDDWVLVKGSRGMAMETIVHDIKNWRAR